MAFDWSPTHREVLSVHKCDQCDGDGIAIDEDSYVGVCAKCTGFGLLTDYGKPYKYIEVTVSTEVTVSDKPYTDDGV